MSITGWIILAAVVLLLLYVIGIYNRLVRLRALVKEGFSGITVQLRRRAFMVADPPPAESARAVMRPSRHRALRRATS